MGVKSVIDVDVNTGEFAKFQEYFQKYQDALAKTPKAWKEVAQEQRGGEKIGSEMAAAMLAQNKMLHEMESTEEKRAGTLHNTVENWKKLAGYGGSFAKSVLSVSGEVLKWGTLITGGLAAGSIFGIDKMAHAVSSDRQASMGYGMSVGDLRAFRSNFDRLVNPDAFLSWITQMETDPSKAQAFYAMGGGAPTGDTQADATRMLRAIWHKAQTTPENILAPMLAAYGYQGAPEDLMRMRKTSGEEFGSLLTGYGADRNRFNVGNSGAWQNLSTQFSRNWNAISGALESRIGELTPAFGRLSEGVTHLLTTVINSPAVEEGLKTFTGWLDQASTALQNGDFQKKVDELFSQTGAVVQDFKAFSADLKQVMPDIVRILHFIAHPFGGDGYTPPTAGGDTGSGMSVGDKQLLMAARRAHMVNAGGYGARFAKNSDWTSQSYTKYLTDLEKAKGLPAGFLVRQWMTESGGDLSGKRVSSAGALGPFQFMPKTAAGMGIDPTSDLDAGAGAAIMDAGLFKKYGGDLRKVLAAYNWGAGNLDADVKRYGDQWDRHLPAETQAYVAKQMPPGGGVFKLIVRNDTGGSAVIGANGLAVSQ